MNKIEQCHIKTGSYPALLLFNVYLMGSGKDRTPIILMK